LLDTLVASAVNNEEVSLTLVNALSVTDCADSSLDTTLVDVENIAEVSSLSNTTLVDVMDGAEIGILLNVVLTIVTDCAEVSSVFDTILVETTKVGLLFDAAFVE